MTQPAETAPTGTRADLIDAGLALFGSQGFSATSTREIAAKAQTNIASIAYHFGGKDGLYMACAGEIARRVTEVTGAPRDHSGLPPAAAEAMLERLLRGITVFMLTNRDAADMAAFVLHELMLGQSAAIETIYTDLFEPKHRELCQLWSIATGQEAESDATRLAVFSAIGQVVYFRIGGPIVTRRMGWSTLGPDQAGQVADTLTANLTAILERSRLS